MPYSRNLTPQNINANDINAKNIDPNGSKCLALQIQLIRIEEGVFIYGKNNAVFKVLELKKFTITILISIIQTEMCRDTFCWRGGVLTNRPTIVTKLLLKKRSQRILWPTLLAA